MSRACGRSTSSRRETRPRVASAASTPRSTFLCSRSAISDATSSDRGFTTSASFPSSAPTRRLATNPRRCLKISGSRSSRISTRKRSRSSPRIPWRSSTHWTTRTLRHCWAQSNRGGGQPEYPGGRAVCWIFERVLELGWSPERFDEWETTFVRPRDDRSGHKIERFGKKYQWIALSELLARIADNFHMVDAFGGDPRTYAGPWQFFGRDIDPTLPPAPIAPEHYTRVLQGDVPAGPRRLLVGTSGSHLRRRRPCPRRRMGIAHRRHSWVRVSGEA